MAHPLFDLLVYSMFALIGAAPVLLLYQVAVWFVTGEWPAITLALAMDWLGSGWREMSWIGARKMAFAISKVPLAIGFLFAGILGLNAVFWVVGKIE